MESTNQGKYSVKEKEQQKLINQQYETIETLLDCVVTLKSKNIALKTKLKKMSKILNETNKEVGLYK
jgi:hypothetical protein